MIEYCLYFALMAGMSNGVVMTRITEDYYVVKAGNIEIPEDAQFIVIKPCEDDGE